MRLAKHIKKSLLLKLECLQPRQRLSKNLTSSPLILHKTANTIHNISFQNGLANTASVFADKIKR
jgi:hypothetical protein